MDAWLAGASTFNITPPLGVDLTGYGGRPGPADHVLDPLHVRALALGDGTEPPVVLVGIDVLGLDLSMVAEIRDAVWDLVPPERLLLNCSHTHAGPTTAALRCMGQPDPAYNALLTRWIAAAIRTAVSQLRPAHLRFGQAESQIGLNRRELRDGKIVLGQNASGTYDPVVSVLRVEDSSGSPLACWFSHATHPVVMGGQNTGLSAEWPGAAAAALEQVLGGTAVFAQGCCGDINPVRRGDHAVARSVGRELAGAALIAWERAEPLGGSGTAGALETLPLPQRQPSVAEAEAALAEAQARYESAVAEGRASLRDLAPGLLAWAKEYGEAARAGAAPPVDMDVQAVRLGDLVISATAAETFVEIGQAINRRAQAPHAVSLGYTNGCFGYLPTASAFPLGGYEVEGAFKYYGTLMVTPGGERLALEAAERVLRQVGA